MKFVIVLFVLIVVITEGLSEELTCSDTVERSVDADGKTNIFINITCKSESPQYNVVNVQYTPLSDISDTQCKNITMNSCV